MSLDDPDPKVRFWCAEHLADAGRSADAADALWGVVDRSPGSTPPRRER
ncbi:hypothetical protein [Dactylosporangium sp. NPDC051541]